MANEAILLTQIGIPIQMTVADGTGIEKGALLKLTDPNTAALSDGDEDEVAGIAATEKIANTGVTKLAVFREGTFKSICSGSISAGESVSWANAVGGNSIAVSTATAVGGKTAGIAREDGTEGQTIRWDLKIGVGAQAFS